MVRPADLCNSVLYAGGAAVLHPAAMLNGSDMAEGAANRIPMSDFDLDTQLVER